MDRLPTQWDMTSTTSRLLGRFTQLAVPDKLLPCLSIWWMILAEGPCTW